MTKIKIPTVPELEERLAGLDRLLTAKRWERAAIVWAFTIKDDGGRPPNESEETLPEMAEFPEPMATFARRGFAGLSKPHTVGRYRQAWQDAIDQGKAREVHPGDSVELPDLPWPPDTDHHRYNQPFAEDLIQQAHEDRVGVSKVLDIGENPTAMQSAIKASPEVRRAAVEAAVEAIRRDPEAMQAAIAEHPAVMKAAIAENPDARRAAIEAMNEAAEKRFAGKEPLPDPDDRELQTLWVLRNVLKRTNASVTEAARLLLDVTLGDDGIQRDIAHYIDMIKLKADLMHSHVHEGAAFDAALQEMLNSEQ
jgi:hypothetical protein